MWPGDMDEARRPFRAAAVQQQQQLMVLLIGSGGVFSSCRVVGGQQWLPLNGSADESYHLIRLIVSKALWRLFQ
jgi:hypothetical protein